MISSIKAGNAEIARNDDGGHGANARLIRNRQTDAMLRASLAIFRLAEDPGEISRERLMQICLYLREQAL